MKKKLAILSLCASMSLFALEKIGVDSNKEVEQPRGLDKVEAVAGSKAIEKQEPVSDPSVKYDRAMLGYSIFEHDKKFFKNFIEQKKLPNKVVANMYHNVADTDALVLTAFAYDYAYERPDLADAYYQKFLTKKDIKFSDKLRYVDFLMRTGRPEKIQQILGKGDCVANFNESSRCFYYLGVADYVQTGNNKNTFIRIAKSKQDKAMEIWNLK